MRFVPLLLALVVLAGCRRATPPAPNPPVDGTAYIRLVNLSHHSADFRLDGVFAAKDVRPGDASEFCILSSSRHRVDAESQAGTLASQSIAFLPGTNYSLVVADPGGYGPRLISGEDREPAPGMACMQAASLTGRPATLIVGSTPIPLGLNGVVGARTELHPGTFTWFSGTASGTARLEPGACYTVFIGDSPGTLWFRTEVHRKPES